MSLEPIKIDSHTKAAQAAATNPGSSAWVSANAGSGKTYVLTRRVVRLLLAGNDPSRILCLTFTKAGAGVMSNRVFELLASWVVMDEAELAQTLGEITGEKADEIVLANARRLFARALETPGGLKILTIHSFCESLLHQFPLEANIAGHFEVLDEMAQRQMIVDARNQAIVTATAKPDTQLGRAFKTILAAASDQRIEKSFDEIVKKRHALGTWFAQANGAANAMAQLRQQLGVADGDTVDDIIQQAFPSEIISNQMLESMVAAGHDSDKSTDQKLADKIAAALASDNPQQKFAAFRDVWLTYDTGAKTYKSRAFSRFCTNNIKSQFTDLEQMLADEGARLIAIIERVTLLQHLEQSEAMFVLAEATISRFEASKRSRGLLDYDDLIVQTANLLHRSGARHWVQYKLDQGIDHLLVDEAQDTSPHQWQVIRALIDDYFSGQGAHSAARTVFAVGDEKQSIYSFQGAEPDAFAEQRDWLKARAEAAGKPFAVTRLNLSFRSTPDVLTAVDKVFSTEENYAGLSSDNQPTIHNTIRHMQPGRVDIWPVFIKQKSQEPDDWTQPVDVVKENDPQILLAERIAGQVDSWLQKGEMLEGQGRKIRAGDVLVLVRTRDRFSTALTRALKSRNIPVAGSDRLRLTDHIVVQDLLVLARFVLMPQDDLSLAAVLKSPLFGFDEDMLFELANNRQHKSLFAMLEETAHRNEVASSALQQLQKLRRRADQVPVYEFYANLLGAKGGRRKFASRMGLEVEDILDAFLEQTLAHEQSGLPGLEIFIETLTSQSPDIKREFDLKDDQVKIMTVHAAKGLEAPIIFLVDKGSAPYHGRHDPTLIEPKVAQSQAGQDATGFIWIASTDKIAPVCAEALALVEARASAEYLRLLYVAMTRAEDRLIVCGTAGSNGQNPHCWHNVVTEALSDGAETHLDADGNISSYCWQTSRQSAAVVPPKKPDTQASAPLPDLPDWLDRQLPEEPVLPRPLTPSGAQVMIDADTAIVSANSPLSDDRENPAFALSRGIVIHRLLQTLPDIGSAEMTIDEVVAQRRQAAQQYMKRACADWPEGEIENVLRQVDSVLQDQQFEHVFMPGCSRAEVAISGTIELTSGARLVSGQIDRLVVHDGRALIIDYKTNDLPPGKPGEVPSAYVSQLALYAHLVRRIYPDHLVSAAILWTATPALMVIADGDLAAQLQKITSR